MAKRVNGRLLVERPIDDQQAPKAKARRTRPARSVTVNLVESPLGWLRSRHLISQAQYDAGERLRADWERAQLSPRVTMSWDAAPMGSRRGGSAHGPDLSGSQIDAK